MAQKQIFINNPDDCQWLRDTALKNAVHIPPFASFVLYGNEDCPEKVELYGSKDPLITDIPYTLRFD